MHLPVTEYPLQQFLHVLGKQDSLVCEASDIQFKGAERLYDDACDVGISIRSHHTNRVVRFYLMATERDVDRDITAWTFQACPEEQDRNGSWINLNVVIWND